MRHRKARLLALISGVLALLPGYLAATPLRSDAATSSPIASLSLVNNLSRKPILGVSPVLDDTVVDLTKLANRNLSLQANLTYGAAVAAGGWTWPAFTDWLDDQPRYTPLAGQLEELACAC